VNSRLGALGGTALHSRLFASVLGSSHALRCPCPASYHSFPGGSDAYSPAPDLVILLPCCADMPEFVLTFALSFQNEMFSLLIDSSGLCLSDLAPVSYLDLSLILLLLMCYFQYLNNHNPLQLLISQLFQSLSPEKAFLVLSLSLSLSPRVSSPITALRPKRHLGISKGYSSANRIGAESNLSLCCFFKLLLFLFEAAGEGGHLQPPPTETEQILSSQPRVGRGGPQAA